MDRIIFENKEEIIDKITNYIRIDRLNLLLVGIVPPGFIDETISLYYLDKYNRKEYKDIIILDGFNDINNNTISNINIFYNKVSIHKKILIIYNFDNIQEYIQNLFKQFVNNKIITIFTCKSKQNIYETIITRTNHIYFDKLKEDNVLKYINILSKKYGVNVNEEILEYTKNLNINQIKKIFVYLKLVNNTEINIKELINYLYCIDNEVIGKYLEYVKDSKLNESIEIMYKLYNQGYSVLDIYNFIYDYVINNLNKDNSYIINIISHYINKSYEGFDTQLSLVFFTNKLINRINI